MATTPVTLVYTM